jgi:SagB-type dehydrogenase family enzyme
MATTAGIRFIYESEHEHMEQSGEEKGFPQPPLEIPHEPSLMTIDLPRRDSITRPIVDFWDILENRKTLRRYQPAALSLDELALLLWTTQGVKTVTDRPVTMRTVPSGGARHPFETYLVISRVDGLEPGLYRYLAIDHKLSFLQAGLDLAEQVSQACKSQHHIRDCAVSFWWKVDTERMTWRYSTRGYRYLLMDAGHLCQNLYLAAEAIGCGVCAIGAFSDGELNHFFQVDGKNQFMVYGATVGKR